jgi:hypothetical protein
MRTQTHTHVRAHAHAHASTPTHAHANTDMHARTRTHTRARSVLTPTHTHTHTHTHTRKHAQARARAHTRCALAPTRTSAHRGVAGLAQHGCPGASVRRCTRVPLKHPSSTLEYCRVPRAVPLPPAAAGNQVSAVEGAHGYPREGPALSGRSLLWFRQHTSSARVGPTARLLQA